MSEQSLPRRIARRILRQQPPPWHTQLLVVLAKSASVDVYLELGVYEAETFNAVAPLCKSAIAVDIRREALSFVRDSAGVRTFCGTVQQLVTAEQVPSVDLCFIDADHACESVISDFQAVEALMSPDGLVALHDTWPGTEADTSQALCGDAYLAVAQLRNRYPNWSFVTLPFHPGLTIASRTDAMPGWVH